MFKISWDKETGGILLGNRVTDETLGISPRPVFHEELGLIGLDRLGWHYPRCQEPLLWAQNKRYFYRGEFVFEAKGANIYDAPTIVFAPGMETLSLQPVDVAEMLRRNSDMMFLLESEAIEFIRDVFVTYSSASRSVERVKANQMDFEAMRERIEKKTKRKMAIVREDCDSFDIMPLETARAEGRRVYQGTKVDRFIASFSGGKDSQVILDLCTRAIPSADFEVFYSDTGYELPSSLELYEETKRYYGERFPNLKFHITRNHESVLNYWDKIGTPSDTHRWCCTVMKTAPLYRALKKEDGKSAKIMTLDGVRAEESLRRGNYERLGKGKHIGVYNAHPILRWNTTEIFLYLLENELIINEAYRFGKARVGCLICPFSTAWDDFTTHQKYPDAMKPFVERICRYSQQHKIHDFASYIRERKWKIKSLADADSSKTTVTFRGDKRMQGFVAEISNAAYSILDWLPTLSDFTQFVSQGETKGSFKYKSNTYEFHLSCKGNKTVFVVFGEIEVELQSLLRRIVYKSAYCVQCEACEVECPTGALSVLPTISINPSLCIHCLKCLNRHDRGCIAADCIRMIEDTDEKQSVKFHAYKTFGLEKNWLDTFWVEPKVLNTKVDNPLLNEPQAESLRRWLKDAEINDSKNHLTSLGRLLQNIHKDNPMLVWSIVYTNLCYNSAIVAWICQHVPFGVKYTKNMISNSVLDSGFSGKIDNLKKPIDAGFNLMKRSPIGGELKQGVQVKKGELMREAYEDLSVEAVAYSIYKYAQAKGISFMRVSDFYRPEETSGPYREFGISESELKKKLRALSSEDNRVLIAELNMGLDHITLRDDLTPVSVLELLTK